jgi:hypothetical protein
MGRRQAAAWCGINPRVIPLPYVVKQLDVGTWSADDRGGL